MQQLICVLLGIWSEKKGTKNLYVSFLDSTWCRKKGLNTKFNLLAPELFFLILAHPVYKMWIKQEPNRLELWNKLHFEEGKKRRVCTMFKIFSTCICWINI